MKHEEELDYEKNKHEIFKKALVMNELMVAEAEERPTDSEDSESD